LVFPPRRRRLAAEMKRERDERVKQVVTGVSILVLLMVAVPSLLMTWRIVPGLVGETLGTIMGIVTTPFFMEATFVILGLVIVITLNHFRQVREGDDFVSIEIAEDPEVKNEPEAH
jgi:uncharacterized membrane protein